MLTLTDNASTTVQTLTDRAGLPAETGGLRIAEQDSGSFELALVSGPHPGDDLVSDGTSRVYVDARASQALAGQQLDVEPSSAGTGFVLIPQR